MKISAGGERQLTGRYPHGWRRKAEARMTGVAGSLRSAKPDGDTEFPSTDVVDVAVGECGSALAQASPGPASRRSVAAVRQTAAVRVLIAIEDRHRVYREAIGEFLHMARPGLDVRVACPRGLNSQLRRFGPQIVVHDGPPVPIPDLVPCWVELSLDPSVATVFRMGRVRREVLNPSVRHLLAVIDEAAPACP